MQRRSLISIAEFVGISRGTTHNIVYSDTAIQWLKDNAHTGCYDLNEELKAQSSPEYRVRFSSRRIIYLCA